MDLEGDLRASAREITARLIWVAVNPAAKKYSDFQNTQITCINPAVPSHQRGRLAIVTNAGRDAMDAEGAEDVRHRMRTAKSYGPDASTVGVKLA
jgi:hypothetical protein